MRPFLLFRRYKPWKKLALLWVATAICPSFRRQQTLWRPWTFLLKSTFEEQCLQWFFCGLHWGSGWPCSHTTLTYSIWECRLHSVIFHLPRKALLRHQSGTSRFKPRDDSWQLLVRQANGLLCRSLSRILVIQDCSGNKCHWTWVDYRSHISGGFQWLWSSL